MPETVTKPEFRELAPVFVSFLPEAQVVRGLLCAHGLAAHLRDETIKVMQPFVTGANALSAIVVAPVDEAEAAREIIREARREAALQEEELEATPEERDQDRLERLSLRVRWAVLSTPLLPLAAVLGVLYFERVSGLEPKPKGHLMTVLSTWFALLATVGLLLALLPGGPRLGVLDRMLGMLRQFWSGVL